MATTYKLIASSTVGSGGASAINFSSIPQTYADLKIVISGRLTSGAQTDFQLLVKFNGSSTGYTNRSVAGNGRIPFSYNTTIAGYSGVINGGLSTANTFGSAEIYIPNYTSSSYYKAFISETVIEDNVIDIRTDLNAGLWSNTSAITSIEISSDAPTFAQYSTAYLYGIKKD